MDGTKKWPRAKRYGWMRVYNDFAGHPKWQLIARDTKLSLAEVEAIVLRMLIRANKGKPRGNIEDFSCEEVAANLDLQTCQVEQVYQALEHREWIDREYLVKWDERQPDKEDPTNAERQARRRSRRRKLKLEVNFDGPSYYRPLVSRDGDQCIYCLMFGPGLEVDHMIPICDGGLDDLDNLALACRACNARKSGRSIIQARMQILITTASEAYDRYVTRDITPKTQTQTVKKPGSITKLSTGQQVTWREVQEAGYVAPRQQSLPLPLMPVPTKKKEAGR